MSNEIKGIPGGSSVVGFDIHGQTAGNEGVEIKGADGTIKAGDRFDLSTLDGQKAYLQRLQSLGIRGSDLPSFVTNMEAAGIVTGLVPSELGHLKGLASSISAMTNGSSTNMAGVQGQWADFIAKKQVGSATDVNALVEFVLRESYMETNKDLQFYAQKVRFYNELKKDIREELTRAREALSLTAGQAETAAVSYAKLEFSATPVMKDGSPEPADPTSAGGAGTKAGLEAYIKKLEEDLNSVGDDAQLANVDLQNMLQKQQQTLQMMSNISKMLHDTALAIIRKIGG